MWYIFCIDDEYDRAEDTSLGNPTSDAIAGRVYLIGCYKFGHLCEIVPEPPQRNTAKTLKM